jgi:hypothetical protein
VLVVYDNVGCILLNTIFSGAETLTSAAS